MKKLNLKEYRAQIIKLSIAMVILFLVIALIAFSLWQFGVFEHVKSMAEFGNSFYGWLSYYTVYITGKFLLFVPLGPIAILASTFMPLWLAVLIGSIAEITGGLALYSLGRYGATKLILKITDQKVLDKAQGAMNKGKYTVFLLLLFPFAPNQIIMLLAGMGRMKLHQFLIMVGIAQPIGVATTIYGFQFITLFKPLWLWGSIAMLGIIALMYLSFKYQDKIDSFVGKIFLRRKQTMKKIKKEE